MSLPVVLTTEAEAEFDEAADWYEQQASLGAEITNAVREVLNRISAFPQMHQIVHKDIRRGVVRASLTASTIASNRPGDCDCRVQQPPRPFDLAIACLRRFRAVLPEISLHIHRHKHITRVRHVPLHHLHDEHMPAFLDLLGHR